MDILQILSQVKELEKIKNPSLWVTEAIAKMKQEINIYEVKQRINLSLQNIIEKIEKLKSENPELEIKYSVSIKSISRTKSVVKNKLNTKRNKIANPNSKQQNDYSFKQPKAIIFKNKAYSAIITWKDVLEKVCNIMQELHPNDIEKIMELRGPNRIYFTTQLNQLNSDESKFNPRKIKNTNIYIETHWSANSHVKICYKVIELFGYGQEDLQIIIK